VSAQRQNLANQFADLQRKALNARAKAAGAGQPASAGSADDRATISKESREVRQQFESLANDNPMPVIMATIEAVTPGMPPTRPYVPQRPRTRSRVPLALGVASAVVLLAAASWLLVLRARRRMP